METVKVKDLKFTKVPLNEAQQFCCNYCGQAGFTNGWRKAIIPFSNTAVFKLLMCSLDCVIKFKSDETGRSQALVDETIEEVKKVHFMKKQDVKNN